MGDAPGSRSDAAPSQLRSRLAVALDVDDLVVATRIAQQLKPFFGVAKVGLELFSATGSESVAALRELGYKVLLDLKLHDIPTTVGRASRVLGALGPAYVTMHAHGGSRMLEAGVEGLAEGSSRAGVDTARALAVTVLTSDTGAPPHVLLRRVQLAKESGCAGVVCAGSDVAEAKRLAPELVAVVPGIRPAGAAAHDQARPSTPEAALGAGADLIVIGRTVTAAPEPRAAASALVEALV